MLPSYEQASFQQPPSYWSSRYLPPNLHVQKPGETTILVYETGEKLLLTLKKTSLRPSLFIHQGPDETAPVVISNKVTTWPVQKRFCFRNHEKDSDLTWIELVKTQDLSTCAFRLPTRYGSRHLVWHMGNAEERFKGPWSLKDFGGGEGWNGNLLCSFERPALVGKGPGTLRWTDEVSREEELGAIIALMVTYLRLKDDGRLAPVRVAGFVDEAAIVAGAVLLD